MLMTILDFTEQNASTVQYLPIVLSQKGVVGPLTIEVETTSHLVPHGKIAISLNLRVNFYPIIAIIVIK